MGLLTTLRDWLRPAPKSVAPHHGMRGQYAAAASNRLTTDWVDLLLSVDRETKGSLRKLRGRSRQLFRDNAHAAGFRQSFVDQVLGSDGIGCSPRIRFANGKTRRELNDHVWEQWLAWGRREVCSADGQSSWQELERLVLGVWLMDGEVLVRRIPGFDNRFGYALQVLDADLLDESYNVAPVNGRNEITQGVEVDAYGRPVAYHLWTAHPSERATRRVERVRVPADQILHLFAALRPGQRRGVPILTPVMIALKMLDGYTEAEVTAARIAASTSGFFTMTGEDAQNLGIADTTDGTDEEDTPIVMEMEPGLARELPPGRRFEAWDASHPNGNFGEFQKAMLHVIARGVGASYISMSGDLSDTSFASGRQGLIAERRSLRAIQRWLVSRWHEPVYADWLTYAALSGAVLLPTPEPSRYRTCRWDYPGFDWIDPEKDGQANVLAIALRVKSPQRIAAEFGVDYEDVLDEMVEARDWHRERGLEWVDPVQTLLGKTAAANGATGATAPQPGKATNGNGNGNGHARIAAALLPLPTEPT